MRRALSDALLTHGADSDQARARPRSVGQTPDDKGADQSRSKLDAIGASPERTRAEDDLWTAEENGYRAGRIGVPIEDAPYEAGTELHAGWVRFWRQGQEAIAKELGPDTEQVTPRRRPRQTRMPGTEARDRETGMPRRRGRPPKIQAMPEEARAAVN